MNANPNFLTPGYLLVHRYSIQSTIGQGGFGITYLAYDQKLDQEVCIKELFVSGNNTRGSNFTVQSQGIGGFSFEEFVQRFVQEARQLARFQHPNIVRVSDIFQENETAYTVMEYVKGETLKSKVSREGALGEKEAMFLISQLLDAVEEVHQKGMLHRDIKPDNVLITQEGRVVLIDFGSAREFAEGKTTTQTAMLTPGYAPIEQYSMRAQRGPYSDIYALGATMYFLLTGDKPIPATDRVAEELFPPHKVNSRVTSQLSSAVMLAMELKSEHRFQQVSDMREALKMLGQRKEKPAKKPEKKTEEGITLPPSIPKKGYGGKIAVAVLVLVFCIGTAYYIYSRVEPPIDLGEGEQNGVIIDFEEGTGKTEKEQDKTQKNDDSQMLQNLRNDMVLVQGGTFTMGCTSEQEGENCVTNEYPAHQVRLRSFFISKHEVTQALWQEVMGSNPSQFKGCDYCPVENVSYFDVQGFIQILNHISGENYRLPTETEWEYAARGGSRSRGYKYSGGDIPEEVGWHYDYENSSNKTYPVGQKLTNELGLYDMSGNVFEWCSDWLGEYSSSAKINPIGSYSGSCRGGSYAHSSWEARVSYRYNFTPDLRIGYIGFRLALSHESD